MKIICYPETFGSLIRDFTNNLHLLTKCFDYASRTSYTLIISPFSVNANTNKLLSKYKNKEMLRFVFQVSFISVIYSSFDTQKFTFNVILIYIPHFNSLSFSPSRPLSLSLVVHKVCACLYPLKKNYDKDHYLIISN